jgi:dipeptidyl aminopeptidase/acylaminoacyl peptidase
MIDFHGSVGYGQSFTDSIRGDYGGKPYVDLMKGLDAALERYPWMDGDRLTAVGRSFAGFMVNWIAGQEPERFRCLVSHAGRLDERSAYLSTDELWFPEWDHEGTLWENPAGYATHNPIDYIQQWQTPMLIIHGGQDYRVALSQSVATFTALQRRGIESQFLYFPDEGHSVSRPQNIVQWHKVVLDWFERCL